MADLDFQNISKIEVVEKRYDSAVQDIENVFGYISHSLVFRCSKKILANYLITIHMVSGETIKADREDIARFCILYSFDLMVPTVQDAGNYRAVVYKLQDEQRIN